MFMPQTSFKAVLLGQVMKNLGQFERETSFLAEFSKNVRKLELK